MIKESLFAAEEREAKLDRLGDVLREMERHIDCKALAAEIDRAAPRPSRERGGRPPFPTELMVRALILQHWYGLSDEPMEYQVLDRLSFQRFLGLRRSSQVPDRTPFWTFRERLTATQAGDALFEAVNRQLARHGDIARGGQIVDASLVPVPRQHVTEEERAQIKAQAMPADWKPAERRQRDVDATWTKKPGKSYFGYTLSVSADRRYKLIRKLKVSTARQNDTLHLEDVLDSAHTGRDLYGDKGYVDGEREARLKSRGWRVHIQRKAEKGRPLSVCQKRRNSRIARVRARVEHVFAAMEQMGGKLLRCIGLDRARFLLAGKAATYNLRRLCSLKACGVMAF